MGKVHLAAIGAAILSATVVHAAVLPIASIGDPYSGVFSINPDTPLSSFTTATNFIYEPVGTFTVLIDGGTFSSPINVVEAVPGSGDTYRWFLSASGQPATLNGTPIPSSVMSIVLYGTTNSTSILPLALSSYSTNNPLNFFTGPNFQMIAETPDKSEAAYAGPLTSLVQIDDKGDFTFGGVIEETEQFKFTPSVPEPSTWAMLLIGFAAIGFAGYLKRASVGVLSECSQIGIDPVLDCCGLPRLSGGAVAAKGDR